MDIRHFFILAALILVQAVSGTASAGERIVFIGPKTIGPGWKDKIVIEPRQFAEAKVGDVLTVYVDKASRTAQASFQNPDGWQPMDEQYKYFGVADAFRLTVTEAMLPTLKQWGVAVGGHDYRILYAALTSAADYKETTVWSGPAVRMGSDWSGCAEIKGSLLTTLEKGDALRLHISHTKEGSAVKIMDLTWRAIDATVDGAPAGGDTFDYCITSDAPLIKIALAGGGAGTALRIGGKDYQLNSVGIVKYTGGMAADTIGAQRAPKEYTLAPGELFHGEQAFPFDWSGNARFTAEPFQHSTTNDVLVISYRLLPQEAEGKAKCDLSGVVGAFRRNATPAADAKAQMSLRENRGKWLDLGGGAEPQWMDLDGEDVVYTFDEASLDRVKTRGLVVTGRGFVLTRVELLKVE